MQSIFHYLLVVFKLTNCHNVRLTVLFYWNKIFKISFVSPVTVRNFGHSDFLALEIVYIFTASIVLNSLQNANQTRV